MTATTQAQDLIWTEQRLQELFTKSNDVHMQNYRFGTATTEVILVHCSGLIDSRQINTSILRELEIIYDRTEFMDAKSISDSQTLPIKLLQSPVTEEQIEEYVFEGALVLFFPNISVFFSMDLAKRPERTPEESSTEISIKGPKDGFVEDIVTNVALVRKRIRSRSLCYESFTIGTRTKTKVALLYIDDVISPQILREAKKRLSNVNVNINGITGIDQIETILSDSKYALFPLVDYTGRPDYVVSSLLVGRFVIIVDGIPTVLIAPASFLTTLKSPEDVHFNFIYVSFARLIRLISLFLSLFLPGLWVALTMFHQDQIPFSLLASIVTSRQGIPFPPAMELLLLLLLLEIFREAGYRLPTSIGQTLTVVGGLIIGDAAIRSGLVSPSVVVVGAITAVSGSTLVNQNISNSISVIRLIIFLFSSILGIYGLLLSIFALVTHLSMLKSFGVPYLSPISPLNFKDGIKAIIRLPWSMMRKRPANLQTTDSDTQGDDST
ncbi:spore germination protein [Paenibacillus albiflavus]|uniref:Spore germination protein n=1 Tax=Paenibacillus albiflavus TaxID=2545760 RepID=A0A4V2WNE4_9BACL|nr:spore germination protein [Paenibacillus albiflavus]TCZ75192.1 spore germination protein [Paenibacillus albiflavus]